MSNSVAITKAEELIDAFQELKVYKFLLQGKTRVEIARELEITPDAVSTIFERWLKDISTRKQELQEMAHVIMDARLEDLYAIARERVEETEENAKKNPVNWKAFDACLKVLREKDKLMTGGEIKQITKNEINVQGDFVANQTLNTNSDLYETALAGLREEYIETIDAFKQEVDERFTIDVTQEEPPELLKELEGMVRNYVAGDGQSSNEFTIE